MKVVINGLAALKPKTGVGHHIVQLADHLAKGYPADEFDLYPGASVGRLIARFVHKPAKAAVGGRPSPLSPLKETAKSVAKWASRAHFAGYAATGRFDLYHEPNFLPYRSHLPTVVTVHDLSVMRHPEWHPADRVRLHDRHFVPGVERAARVVVVSDAVRRELIADTGVSPDKVSVVFNGMNPTLRPMPPSEVVAARRRLGLPDHYFLCVGTIEPRKNVGTVLRAFADLPAAVREVCPLLLAGPWGWKSGPDREAFDRLAGPRGARHLGYVPDADLPFLYAGATALLYPSFYEGFGLPPLEMLACGGAVLASTADAVREVVGRHGWFTEPDDSAGWREAMLRAATDREFVAGLKAGGVAHAAGFTWDRAARDTAAVYRRALNLPVEDADRRAA